MADCKVQRVLGGDYIIVCKEKSEDKAPKSESNKSQSTYSEVKPKSYVPDFVPRFGSYRYM